MLVNRLFSFFIPKNISEEDITLSYCKNLVGAGLISFFACPIYAVIYYFLAFPKASLVLMIACVCMLASLFVLKYLHSLLIASTVFVSTFTALILWLSFNLGGIFAATAYWLAITPLIASYIAGIRTGYFWSILTILAITMLYLINYSEVNFPSTQVNNPLLLKYLAMLGMSIAIMILVYFYDISKKAGYAKLKQIAFVDPLTQIPNRKAYEELLKNAIDKAQKNNTPFYLLYLDIDQFKKINNILGNMIADLLLTEVIRRIKICIRHTDIMARVGGDEFKIIIENIHNHDELNDIVSVLLKSFEVPFHINNHEIKITISIGVVTNVGIENFNYNYVDQYAETALSKAKTQGGNSIQYYNDTIANENALQIEIEHLLPNALLNNEFYLCYQMQYDAHHPDRMTGFEVLLRWNNPKHGEVPSNIFIPIAEKTGIISQIGKWVVREACVQYMRWQKDGLVEQIPMAINISAYQLYTGSVVKFLSSILKETGMSANNLELELTETAMITDPVFVINMLKRINELGIKTVIDDFGSGYTSLSYLSLFPVSGLKIDKLFLDHMIENENNTSIIIESVIDLAHKINLKVIVEGIENIEQLNYLQKINCDYVQGFYLCKPLGVNSTTSLLRSYRAKFQG